MQSQGNCDNVSMSKSKNGLSMKTEVRDGFVFTSMPSYATTGWKSAYHTNSNRRAGSVMWLAKLQSFVAFHIIQKNVQLNISTIDYKVYMGKDGRMVVKWK